MAKREGKAAARMVRRGVDRVHERDLASEVRASRYDHDMLAASEVRAEGRLH